MNPPDACRTAGLGRFGGSHPLSAALFVWLLAQPARDKAWLWALAVAACTGTTAVLKIYFASCPPAADLHSPSGHTSFSTLVFGAFAVSRIALNAHSPAEVAWGGAIGGLSLAVFACGYRRAPPERGTVRLLLVAAAALILFLHGTELHAEEILHAVSAYWHASGNLSCAL